VSLESVIYRELEDKLFPNMTDDDFIQHFVCEFTNKYIKEGKLGIIPTLIIGNKRNQEIKLRPPPGKLTRNRYEYCSAIVKIYNEDYWLIKLWIRMYADAREFDISRELVRSFIKRCLSVTTQELVNLGVQTLDKSCVKRSNLSIQTDYYKKIFNVQHIVRGMRQQPRDLLINRYKKNRWHQQALNDELLITDTVLQHLRDLLNRHEFGEYINLIDICREYEGDRGVHEPIKALLLYLRTFRGKRALRKEIIRVIRRA